MNLSVPVSHSIKGRKLWEEGTGKFENLSQSQPNTAALIQCNGLLGFRIVSNFPRYDSITLALAFISILHHNRTASKDFGYIPSSDII